MDPDNTKKTTSCSIADNDDNDLESTKSTGLLEESISNNTVEDKKQQQSHESCAIRLRQRICGEEDIRNVLGFFLLGVFNNVVYVINNAGAGEIVPGDYATIYLVNTFPALIIKLTGPYWFHYVPYNVRIITASLCIVLNFILVMYGSTTWLKLLGVFFGAVQGGLGEATLLGSAALYNDPSRCIGMWSSGTGFAGILGFILEIFILKNASDWVRLLVGLIIVGIFLGSFFLLLQAPTNGWPTKETRSTEEIGKMTFIERFRRVLSLWPYIIPLVLVYFAEYAIQAGAWTAYSFDPSQVDNLESRNDAYLWLNLMYQIGVFISRSSTILFVANRCGLWIMPFLQIGMLLFFSFNATEQFWNGLSLLFPALFVGLLGGGVYVNAFTLITKEVDDAYEEFSLSAASVADTFGSLLGDVFALFLQSCLFYSLGLEDDSGVTCPFE